jgi:RimJ/RimL family protein N-acetyltransferase
VVLYAYDLSRDHDYEFKTSMKVEVARFEDVERLYNDDLNQDIRSIEWKVWKEKISNGLWRGFVCKDGERIVAQCFYSVEDIFLGGTKHVVLSMPAGCAYGFKLFTREDYRGKKLGHAITSFRINNVKQEGIRAYFTAINADNVVSRHVEERMGGFIVFLKCRFFNKVFLSPWLIKRGFVFKNKEK